MKDIFKVVFTVITAAFIVGCTPAVAAVPLRWTVETSRATPQRIDIYRGETVTVAADLTSYGRPLALAGEAALYVQTNGMGSAWWTVPATVASNRIEATLAPSAYPADASLLTCHLGGPAINYRAAFQARILGSPGTAPNTVQPPVSILDFAALTVVNSPYCTRTEVEGLLPDLSGFAKKSDLNYLKTQGISIRNSSYAEVYLYLSDDGTRLVFNRGGGAAKVEIPLDDMLYGTVALASDIPDTDEFVKNMGGSATNLAVYAKPGLEEAEPALSVHGYVDASHGFVSGLDGGVFFYSGTGAAKSYVAELSTSSDGSARWDTFGHGESGRLALMGDAERAGLYSLRTASAYSAASNAVQYVTLPSTASALQISQPPAAAGRVRDWVVYVMAAKDVTVSYDATAHWYSPDAGGAKAVKASTLTAMYFSEIGNNADGKPQFAVSLHELEEVK